MTTTSTTQKSLREFETHSDLESIEFAHTSSTAYDQLENPRSNYYSDVRDLRTPLLHLDIEHHFPPDIRPLCRWYINTVQIHPSHLGYSIGPREAQEINLESLPVLDKENFRLGDTLLTSWSGLGSNNVAVLGSYYGKPVACLTTRIFDEYKDQEEMFFQSRVMGSKLASDLGIGPVLHGVYTDPRSGRNYVVMNIAPGDFSYKPQEVDSPVTERISLHTFSELAICIQRLQSVSIEAPPGDAMQFFVSAGGHITFIDSVGLHDYRGIKLKDKLDKTTFDDQLTWVYNRAPEEVKQKIDKLEVCDNGKWNISELANLTRG